MRHDHGLELAAREKRQRSSPVNGAQARDIAAAALSNATSVVVLRRVLATRRIPGPDQGSHVAGLRLTSCNSGTS